MKRIKGFFVLMILVLAGLFVFANTKIYADGSEDYITFTYTATKEGEELARLEASGVPDEQVFKKGVMFTHIIAPTSPNYAFKYWAYLDENGQEKRLKAGDKFYEDTEFYGVWELIIRVVSYEMYGGVNTYLNPFYFYGTDDIYLVNPTKSGYAFGGWYDNQDFEGEAITYLGNGVKSLTLHAKWIEVLSVTFNINYPGGVNPEPVTINDGDKLTELPVVPREGYSFKGWLLDGEPFDIEEPITENIELVASWEANSYTVSFNLGYDAALDSIEVIFDSPYGDLPAPTRSGYLFAGWYLDETLVNSETIVKVAADHQLVAKWTLVDYDIVYQNTNDLENLNPVKYNTETETIILLPLGNTSSHKFNGWFDEDDNEVTEIPQGSLGDITLYAKWERYVFDVVFETNGGSEVDTQQVEHGNNVAMPEDPTKEGYLFAGWFTTQEFTALYDFGEPVDKDLTLYAKWDIPLKVDSVETNAVDGQITGGLSFVVEASGTHLARMQVRVLLNDESKVSLTLYADESDPFGEINEEHEALYALLRGVTYEDGKWEFTFDTTALTAYFGDKTYDFEFRVMDAQSTSDSELVIVPIAVYNELPAIEVFTIDNAVDGEVIGSATFTITASGSRLESIRASIYHPGGVGEAYFIESIELYANESDPIGEMNPGKEHLYELIEASYDAETQTWIVTFDIVGMGLADKEYRFQAIAKDGVLANQSEATSLFVTTYNDLPKVNDVSIEWLDGENYGIVVYTVAASGSKLNALRANVVGLEWVELYADSDNPFGDKDWNDLEKWELFLTDATYSEGVWTITLDTTAIEDGLYELEFVAVDINGLTSQAYDSSLLVKNWFDIEYVVNPEPVTDESDFEAEVTEYKYGTGLTLEIPNPRTSSTFVGWYDNDEFTGETILAIPATTAGNVKYYALWELKEYDVTFLDKEGEEVEVRQVKHAHELGELPAHAELEGFEFIGWRDNEDIPYTEYMGIYQDLTLQATYLSTYAYVTTEGELTSAFNNPKIVKIIFADDIVLTSNHTIIRGGFDIDTDEYSLTLGEYTLTFGQTAGLVSYNVEGLFYGGTIVVNNTNGHFEFNGNDGTTTNVHTIASYNQTVILRGVWENVIVDDTVGHVVLDNVVIKKLTTSEGTVVLVLDDVVIEDSDIEGKVYQDEIVDYTVTFLDYDDNELDIVLVPRGGTAMSPEVPKIDGLEFIDWDTDFTNVTEDLIVKALYNASVYSVVFKDKDNNVIVERQVEYGQAAVAPDVPEVEGFEFAGWDVEFTYVIKNLVVTAQYKIKEYNVLFVDGEETLDELIVIHGNTVEQPEENPIKLFYDFLGWYLGEELYDFNLPVLKNIELVAKWEAKDVYNETKETYHLSIQEAIDEANSGDTILINSGTYKENLVIEKSIILKSLNGYEETIIDANFADYGIIMLKPNLELVVIEGITLTNWVFGGIIQGMGSGGENSSVHVLNNKILAPEEAESYGNSIQVSGNGSIVSGNTLEVAKYWDGSYYVSGILVVNAEDVLVENNTINGSDMAIGVQGGTFGNPTRPTKNITIRNNTITDIDYGIGVYSDSTNVTIEGNIFIDVFEGVFKHTEKDISPDLDLYVVFENNTFPEGYGVFEDTIIKLGNFYNYITLVSYETLNEAIAEAYEEDIILIAEGTHEIGILTIDKSLTIEGITQQAKLKGTLIVKADGVELFNFTLKNYGNVDGVNDANRGGVYVFAADIVIEDVHFISAIGENGLANAIQLMSSVEDNSLSNYTIKNNIFENYSGLIGDKWGSSGIAITEGFTSGTVGGYSHPISATNEDYDLLETENTFINVKIDVMHQNWIGGNNVLYPYTITYLVDGEEYAVTYKVKAYETITAPEAPTKEFNTFIGWYLDEIEYNFDAEVISHLELVAKWELIKYIVIFKDIDGEVLDTQIVKHGKDAQAPANPDNKENHHFTGWDKAFTNVTEDLTVTALYAINTYTVMFVDYDETEIDTQTVEHGSAAEAPTDPTRDGYRFIGWDVEFTNITKDLVITAMYEEEQEELEEYLIYFNDFEIEPEKSYQRNEILDFDLENTIKWNVETESGSDSGILWDYSSIDNNIGLSQGTNMARIHGKNLTTLTSTIISSVTRFEIDAKFYGNRSDGVLKIYAKGDGDDDFVLADKLELESLFKTFIIEINKTNVQIRLEATGERSNIDNIKIYGLDNGDNEVKVNKITFDLGNDELFETFVYTGKALKEPLYIPEKEGHTHAWFADSLMIEAYDFTEIISEDIMIYLGWDELQKYTVTFDYNGDDNDTDNLIVYVYEDEKVDKPTNPTKEEHDFKGWFVDLEDETAFNFNNLITEDLTLIAKWVEKEQEVEYDFHETFEYRELPTSYSDGSFDGFIGTAWKYGNSRDQEKFPIDGKGLLLQRASDSYLEITFPNGLSAFSFEYRKAYTGSSARELVVIINGVQLEQTTGSFGTSSVEEKNIYVYNLQNLTYGGEVVLKIKNIGTTATNRHVVIDNVKWNEYDDGLERVTVTFDLGEGTPTTTKVVVGETIAKPEDPNKTGYDFLGWYLGENEYDFSSAVVEDITLVAKWEEKQSGGEELEEVLFWDFGSVAKTGYGAGDLTWTNGDGSTVTANKDRTQINKSDFEPHNGGHMLILSLNNKSSEAWIELDFTELDNMSKISFEINVWNNELLATVKDTPNGKFILQVKDGENWTDLETVNGGKNLLQLLTYQEYIEVAFDVSGPGLYRIIYFGTSNASVNTTHAVTVDNLKVFG